MARHGNPAGADHCGMSQSRVVVVGAGPSGAATALALSGAGHAVTVLERARFPRDKACGEGLMPPGVGVLRRLGVLDEVLATGPPRIRGVMYAHCGRSPQAYAPFPRPPDGGEGWGLGVRRTTFDAALAGALRRAPGVTLIEGVRATGVRRDVSGRISAVDTGADSVPADIVIAADGLHSPMRAAAGWTGAAAASGRYGLVGHWRLDVRTVDRITVTFAQGQEWYQAPVGSDLLLVSTLGGRRRIGLTSGSYESAARAAVPALWSARLDGPVLAAGQFRQRSRTVASDGLFLVGDAAGYDDPTTGEGIAVGLLLAERLGAHIAAVLRGDVDRATAELRYRRDHAALWRNRTRVTSLALLMARSPRASRRAVARAAERPDALARLLGINCGYWGFGVLSARDWLSLGGF
jgi:2-polyprenyl-6-methoxyphenol hydroxylase-like FAD-dependent oxidoreductase